MIFWFSIFCLFAGCVILFALLVRYAPNPTAAVSPTLGEIILACVKASDFGCGMDEIVNYACAYGFPTSRIIGELNWLAREKRIRRYFAKRNGRIVARYTLPIK